MSSVDALPPAVVCAAEDETGEDEIGADEAEEDEVEVDDAAAWPDEVVAVLDEDGADGAVVVPDDVLPVSVAVEAEDEEGVETVTVLAVDEPEEAAWFDADEEDEPPPPWLQPESICERARTPAN
jgi:hypothetical protein